MYRPNGTGQVSSKIKKDMITNVDDDDEDNDNDNDDIDGRQTNSVLNISNESRLI